GAGACRPRSDGGGGGASLFPDGGVLVPDDAAGVPRRGHVLYPGAPASFVDLVRDAAPSVVAIRATIPVRSGPAAMFPGAPPTASDTALGTGCVIESRGRDVVTNDHVLGDVADVKVGFTDGTELPARIVGRDPRLDLALLAIDAPRAPALRLADTDDVEVGEWAVVLGNPFGDEVSASAGIVSATGRTAAGSLVPGPAIGFRTFLQLDARVHRGNSGGPVLSTAGEVIGVAVATGERPGELAFAIPAARVREVLEPLKRDGVVKRAWIGVLARPVTRALADQLGLPAAGGALVTEVKPSSPAARLGLRPGDVIQAWNGRPVDDRSLPWLAAAAPAGTPVELTLWRDRATLTAQLVPEPMPE
ncbi:MAG TPA: trypsin-like peptidase domain-containing protein, partial [Kofleriaceae bacterium]|nr:trypsin-like peptidase domain-containing protein [Kofleriaceae bacterium]